MNTNTNTNTNRRVSRLTTTTTTTTTAVPYTVQHRVNMNRQRMMRPTAVYIVQSKVMRTTSTTAAAVASSSATNVTSIKMPYTVLPTKTHTTTASPRSKRTTKIGAVASDINKVMTHVEEEPIINRIGSADEDISDF